MSCENNAAENNRITDGFPMLQNPSSTAIDVVWAVRGTATGYVEYSESPDLSDTRVARRCQNGLAALDNKVLTAHLNGLEPNKKYFYRTITQAMTADDPYDTHTDGSPVYGETYSFQTLGAKYPVSIAVINDTHEKSDIHEAVYRKIAELGASVLVTNGDIMGEVRSEDFAVSSVIKPVAHPFASTMPVLYVPGNHDYRGRWAREFQRVVLPRQMSERKTEFSDLTRNFAVRIGDVAAIGMDTGEDKPDRHPVWAGLACFEAYREKQTEWLKNALEAPDISSAPYVLLFCHIPLFDPDPDSNPGDTLQGYAYWSKQCAGLWRPLIEKYGVQAVVSGHVHAHRIDLADSERPWHQVVGGGCDLHSSTVIHIRPAEKGLAIDIFRADENNGPVMSCSVMPRRAV